MLKTILLSCGALSIFVLPAYAADDTSCTPKNQKPAELVRAINCLQQRVIKLEATQPTLVRTDDPRLNNLVHTGDLSAYLKSGSTFKLGFDTGRCLAAPSGVWDGSVGNPPVDVKRFTLLQDCGGAVPMRVNP